LREREINLKTSASVSSSDNETLKLKCDRLQTQLNDANAKNLSLKQQLAKTAAASTTITAVVPKSLPLNLQDLSDDLGKVLMSKEEVITQLEKQLKEKEKHILALTEQLEDEMVQVNKVQEACNVEMSRSSDLNAQLKQITNEKYVCVEQLNALRDELKRSLDAQQTLETNLVQSRAHANKCECDLARLQEYTRNETEIQQEEIKTLEYKLVHSQRQAQEYQAILEDMDLANTNAINALSQVLSACGGSFEYNDQMSTNSNLQNRLKRNQSLVQLITQQILQIKNKCVEQLSERLQCVQSELDEVKEENVDLNGHIYSIDVFMREKEAQCDQYQREKEELIEQLMLVNKEAAVAACGRLGYVFIKEFLI
jgi:chromosome segregation ATPase